MAAQKHFITHRITCQIRFVNRILSVIIFFCHMISPSQLAVDQFSEQNNRIQLLRISHKHQFLSTDNRDKRDRNIALAGLVHNGHVKQRLWFPDLMCRYAGSDNNRKNTLQLLYIFGFLYIFVECPRLCLWIFSGI